RPNPALLITMSSRPHVSSARSTSASPTAESPTSPRCATASPPAAAISRATSAAGSSSVAAPSVATPASFTPARAPYAASLAAGAVAQVVDLLTHRDPQPDVAVRAAETAFRRRVGRLRLDEHEHERPGQIADPGHRRTGVGIGPAMYHMHARVATVEIQAR